MTDRDLTPAVTDADREAAYTLEACIAALGNAPFSESVEQLCEQAIARARAEGAASEREACIADVRVVRAGFIASKAKALDAGRLSVASHRQSDIETCERIELAIRARGERFPLSGADAPSEGGKA